MAVGFYGFPALQALKENHLTDAYIPKQRPGQPTELWAGRDVFLWCRTVTETAT